MPPSVASLPVRRGRFAPSPTGPLHLGSLTAALGSWLMARHSGGEWLVRIEDLDPPREVPGMAQRHLQDLAALGLVSDGPVIWQSQRSPMYERALRQLTDDGLAFECRCSRTDLARSGGIHRNCVSRPSGSRPAWRLRVPARTIGFRDAVRGRVEQSLADEVGDFVLKRADGLWAYQLAVVVDDALQEISDVVRGADLIDSTPRQILLQQMLGYPTPTYAHLPVIRRPDGTKLGKSLSSQPLDPREPLPALRLAYEWLGQCPEAADGSADARQFLDRALAAFDPGRIPAEDRFLPID